MLLKATWFERLRALQLNSDPRLGEYFIVGIVWSVIYMFDAKSYIWSKSETTGQLPGSTNPSFRPSLGRKEKDKASSKTSPPAI